MPNTQAVKYLRERRAEICSRIKELNREEKETGDLTPAQKNRV